MQNENSIGLYNAGLLAHQMRQLNFTPESLAEASGVSWFSIHAALAGNLGTLKKLRQITDALKINWKYITDVDLPESQYHRAVLRAGTSRAAVR